ACDVVEYASGLDGNIPGNDLARFWVKRNLAAAKYEASAAHRLRVRTNRPRSFARGNNLFHAGDSSCKAKSNNERLPLFVSRLSRRYLAAFPSMSLVPLAPFLDFARNDIGRGANDK